MVFKNHCFSGGAESDGYKSNSCKTTNTYILPFNIYNVNKLKNAKVSNQTKPKLTHVINRSARIMVSDGYEYLFPSGRSVQGQDTPLTGIIIITFPRKQG